MIFASIFQSSYTGSLAFPDHATGFYVNVVLVFFPCSQSSHLIVKVQVIDISSKRFPQFFFFYLEIIAFFSVLRQHVGWIWSVSCRIVYSLYIYDLPSFKSFKGYQKGFFNFHIPFVSWMSA